MYTILFILILLIYSLDKSSNKKNYVGWITIFLIIIGGFRHFQIGTDTPGYIEAYLNAAHWNIPFENYFKKSEPLFYIYQDSLSKLNISYTIYLLCIAVFYYGVVCHFIRRYSKDSRLSFFIFIALGHFLFSMAGIRQTIAMGFQLLCFMSLLDKKYLKSVFFLLIACGFHITSISFAVVYLLNYLPLNIPFICIMFALVMIGLTTGGDYAVQAAQFLWEDARVYEESDGGLSVFLILLVLSVFTILIYRKNHIKMKNYRKRHIMTSEDVISDNGFSSLAIKMLLVALFFQAVGTKQADTFRIAYMFDIVAIALIPNAIYKLRLDIRSVFYWVLIFLIILRFYLLILPVSPDFYPYKFFFE